MIESESGTRPGCEKNDLYGSGGVGYKVDDEECSCQQMMSES